MQYKNLILKAAIIESPFEEPVPLRREGLGDVKPLHRQVPLDDYIVDFYCHELNLAIEIDGNTHDYKVENDQTRQKQLEGHGIHFIRFGDNDVKRNLNDILRALEITILEIEQKKAGNK